VWNNTFSDGNLEVEFMSVVGGMGSQTVSARDGEYSTAAQKPYLEFHTGTPDYGMPASQTALYKWGMDLSADSDMPVTKDITGADRYWHTVGCFDGPPPPSGETSEPASLRTAAEFQLAYPDSDEQETGTWTHASTPDLHSAVDDAFGTDDGHVIDSP
jgi:hypothetical protein